MLSGRAIGPGAAGAAGARPDGSVSIGASIPVIRRRRRRERLRRAVGSVLRENVDDYASRFYQDRSAEWAPLSSVRAIARGLCRST